VVGHDCLNYIKQHSYVMLAIGLKINQMVMS